MKYPKMILFDYGHTLLYEPDWDSVRGNAELLKYAIKKPNNWLFIKKSSLTDSVAPPFQIITAALGCDLVWAQT